MASTIRLAKINTQAYEVIVYEPCPTPSLDLALFRNFRYGVVS